MLNLYCLVTTPAGRSACQALEQEGFSVCQEPSPNISGLLLDVPTPQAVEIPWERLPTGCRIFGGNLAGVPERFRAHDLLKDPIYTARNADITARCAIRLAAGRLEETLAGLPVLVIGWGRIGKCLGKRLRDLGAKVRVCARNPADRGMLTALGYEALDREEMLDTLPQYRLVFNTAPESVLTEAETQECTNCLFVDLASLRGITAPRTVWARGLPGKMAPASSGALIAQTVRRLWKEEEA